MELSLLTKLKVTTVIAIGAIFIGMLAYPATALSDPFQPVRWSDLPITSLLTLPILSIILGFACYFVAWPYGREIGILAVPSGLAVWALRSGSITSLIQFHPGIEQRQALFKSLSLDPLFWLALVFAGFAGVLIAQKTRPAPTPPILQQGSKPQITKTKLYAFIALSVVISEIIAKASINIFAQNFRIFDRSAIAQASIGQIAFASITSFAIAAFLIKLLLDIDYLWPIIATALVPAIIFRAYARADILNIITQRWPANFFPEPIIGVSPLQIVAFGSIGAVAGYWMAVRFRYWREHER